MVCGDSSVEQVGEWLASELGHGTIPDVDVTIELFSDAGLDGNLLSTISAEELEALVGIDDPAEVQAILAARDAAFTDTIDADFDAARVRQLAVSSAAQQRSYPPLYQVVKRKDTAMVRRMLEDGIDPNDPAEASPSTSPMTLRRSPLHLSGLYRVPEIMAVLLAFGAAVNRTDGNNWSTLHYAALSGDEGVARLLLKAGADKSIVASQGGALGETPAQFARRHRQYAFADLVEGWASAPDPAAEGGSSAGTGDQGDQESIADDDAANNHAE